jgi:hypothetical protein
MARWSDLEAAEPQLAADARWLLEQARGVAFLATVRRDGAPQVRPIMPIVAGEGLWALIVSMSSKHRDLLRDGRFALHMIPAGDENREVHVAGRARLVEDADQVAAVAEAAGRDLLDFETLFELLPERATGTRWANWPTEQSWPSYVRWRAAGDGA